MTKVFFKVFGIVAALLFLWEAMLQYDSPDAFLWFSVYSVAAVLSILFVLGKLKFSAALLFCILYMASAVFFIFMEFKDQRTGLDDIVRTVEGKEALGLLAAGVIMIVFSIRIKMKN